MSARLRYSPDNRWIIEVFELKAEDGATGTFEFLDSAATVRITVRRRNNGAVVVGETWPFALAYRSGSDGVFWGYLNASLTVDPTLRYEVLVNGDDGASSPLSWVETLEVIDPRRGGD
jgi:hypothetical protein